MIRVKFAPTWFGPRRFDHGPSRSGFGVRGLLMVAGLGTTALGLTGCATDSLVRVKPWQRAALADPTMNPNRDPLSLAMADHVFTSREAASGGRGVGGTGCGCN
jgi:hypothetical protein